MAEMTAKQAIAVLHNNQYQKHIANGEYDYIHPLTDAECKGIESLIQQQQQQIEQQAAEIERMKCCANCNWWNDSNFVGCIDADKDLFSKYNGRRCGKWTGRKEAQGVE